MKPFYLFRTFMVLAGIIMFTSFTFGQGKPYDGPEDPAGDKTAIREGWMNGNRVLLYIKNDGTISDHFCSPLVTESKEIFFLCLFKKE